MLHEIKLQKEFADAVMSGAKNFEVRYNDRGYQKGDKVKFKVMSGSISHYHQLNEQTFEITYVLNGWGIKEDYVVFGIRREVEKMTEQMKAKVLICGEGGNRKELARLIAKCNSSVIIPIERHDSELLDKVAEIFPKSFCTYCNQEACEGGMVGTIQECETIRMIKDVLDGVIEDLNAEVSK